MTVSAAVPSALLSPIASAIGDIAEDAQWVTKLEAIEESFFSSELLDTTLVSDSRSVTWGGVRMSEIV